MAQTDKEQCSEASCKARGEGQCVEREFPPIKVSSGRACLLRQTKMNFSLEMAYFGAV